MMSISNTQQQHKETEEGGYQSVIQKKFVEMRRLLQTMVDALKTQPNITNTIKRGLPRILDHLEKLEGTVQTELRTAQLAAWVFTRVWRQRAVSTTEAVGTPTEPAGSKKRGTSSPPNLVTRKKPPKKKKADPP